jgi:hypothetical protein
VEASRTKNGKNRQAKKANGAKKHKNRLRRLNENSPAPNHTDSICTVCEHECRAEIELMLLRGKRYTTIANAYPPLTQYAIRRHHIGTGMKALTVKECEKLWSDIIRQGWRRVRKVNLDQTLKASEYIARKAGAFKDKHEHKHEGQMLVTLDDIVQAERTAERESTDSGGKTKSPK